MAAAGSTFVVGIDENDTMYTWGRNNHDTLGTSGSDRTTPVALGGTWKSVSLNATSHVVAINSAGELYSWGYNQFGQLGRPGGSAPAQITEGETMNHTSVPDFDQKIWTNSIGGGSFSLAVTSEGELWGWGHNRYGMLGNGENGTDSDQASANRSRPVQIGGTTTRR